MTISHKNAMLEYNNLLDKYHRIVREKYTGLVSSPCKDCTAEHLSWMLTELKQGRMPWGKSCRWLGYIQSLLAVHGLIDVDEERELTRVFLPVLDIEMMKG